MNYLDFCPRKQITLNSAKILKNMVAKHDSLYRFFFVIQQLTRNVKLYWEYSCYLIFKLCKLVIFYVYIVS